MEYRFPYDDFDPIEIPDRQLSGVYSIGEAGGSRRLPGELITEALANPIGSPRLKDRVRPGMKVLIVVDDNTRSTRTELMLPAVISELSAEGVSAGDIHVLVALGTHRPMSRLEMEQKYTPGIVASHRFILPNWQNAGDFEHVESSGDFPVHIHRELLQADFVIGVGQTVPHLIAGFGGGCKIINPGCADSETIGRMHWLCSTAEDGRLFAVRDNPVRRVIDEVGLKAGLKFIINEVPGKNDALAGVFAGDPILAHRAACDFARSSCTVAISELADIVVADPYPSDLDFWQSLKGLNAACSALRPGGTVIFAAPCTEGVCPSHPEIAAIGFRHPGGHIENLVATGQLCPIPAAAIWLGARMLERANVILVTTGVSAAEATAMGLEHASDPAAALALALRRHGSGARINVLHKAAKMICSVRGTDNGN
jgi:nickel-dependent lactate racemase